MGRAQHIIMKPTWTSHGLACPICAAEIGGLFNTRLSAPRPGDWTVCSGCTFPLVFDASLHLAPMSGETMAKLDGAQLDALNDARSQIVQYLIHGAMPRSMNLAGAAQA